jgi:hypothetical protein
MHVRLDGKLSYGEHHTSEDVNDDLEKRLVQVNNDKIIAISSMHTCWLTLLFLRPKTT